MCKAISGHELMLHIVERVDMSHVLAYIYLASCTEISHPVMCTLVVRG